MFETFFQAEILDKILINTLLVSIPEEIYLVMFTLILLGEFDYWRESECKKLFYSYDIKRILLPAITIALLSNILKYTGLETSNSSLFILILFYILIIFTNNVIKDASLFKWMGKMFVFFVIAVVTVGLSELIYLPLVQFSTDLTIEEINSNLLLNILLSLPAKIIQLLIILFLINRKRTLVRNNISEYFFANKLISTATTLLIVSNFLFLWFMNKFIVSNQLFTKFSDNIRFLIIIIVIIFPLVNMSLYFFSIIHMKNTELVSKKYTKDSLIDLRDEINKYYNGEVSDMNWKMNFINDNLTEIAENLYSEDKTKKNNI